MAEYIIQSETLEEIGNQIRSRTGRTDLLSPTEMASHVQLVYAKGYTNGKENLKKEEARTADNVHLTNQGVPEGAYSAYITVNVDAGYYAENTPKTFRAADGDLDSIVDGVYEIGHNDGYDAGYTEGYNDGLADGGGGGDEPYDPTTVWQINDLPVVTENNIYVNFISNGEEFVRINHAVFSLKYYRSDGTFAQAWGSRNGWNTAYQTITFTQPLEEIMDETLELWLDTNATLISGGSGGGEEDDTLSPEDSLTFMEQAQSPSVVYMSVYHYCYTPNIFGQYGGRTVDEMLEMEYSSPSSNPLTISVSNYTDLYAYYTVRATDIANDEPHLFEIEVPPQGNNSIDAVSHFPMGNPCEWYVEVQGVRFTRYAVEI